MSITVTMTPSQTTHPHILSPEVVVRLSPLTLPVHCCTAGLSEIDGIETVAMTTNGIILHRNLAQLQAAGLSVLNISLDTLFEPKYQIISRRRGLYTPPYPPIHHLS